MRIWAAHAVFAIILVGSLAARQRVGEAPISSATFETAVSRVARAQGLSFHEYRTSDENDLHSLVFDASGCARPVFVMWRPATFEDGAIRESAPEQGYLRRYVYIDEKWDDLPSRWAILIQRTKYWLGFALGLTEYAPFGIILQVDTPQDCPAAEGKDWRWAWSPSQLAAAEAEAASPKQQR